MARRVRDIEQRGLRRIPNPGYSYEPRGYRRPYPPQDYEDETPEKYQSSGIGNGLLAALLIVVLAAAVALLYFRGQSLSSAPGVKPVTEQRQSGITPARVAARTLYLERVA